MTLPNRKTIRLKGYDYNTPGYYFITICTKERQKLLCDVVGTGLLDGPQIRLTPWGETAEKQLRTMRDFYDDIRLEHYVVMPNHVHLLLHVLDGKNGPPGSELHPIS